MIGGKLFDSCLEPYWLIMKQTEPKEKTKNIVIKDSTTLKVNLNR